MTNFHINQRHSSNYSLKSTFLIDISADRQWKIMKSISWKKTRASVQRLDHQIRDSTRGRSINNMSIVTEHSIFLGSFDKT
jgi:hypothetical protein